MKKSSLELLETREELERAGKALISAAMIGSDMNSPCGGSNVIGEIYHIDPQAGTVEIVLSSMGVTARKLKFNLYRSASASLGLKEDVVLEEAKAK